MGYECKLIPEQRDDPEFRKLIDEDDMNPIAAPRIESYAQNQVDRVRELS